MKLLVWKRVHLTPSIRLNFYTGGVSISFSHRRIGWITFSKRGIRETLDTPVLGVYLSEGQRWREIRSGQRQGDG